jgi:hypothetical protein
VSLTPSERAALWRRAADSYRHLTEEARAAGTCVTYRLDDLQGFLDRHFARPVCSHCSQPVGAATFELGLRVPSARGGRFNLRNLEVLCPDCRLLKGVLDSQEFRDLRHLLAGWPRPVREDFLARLRAGTPLVRSALPPPGALEWFTGALASPYRSGRLGTYSIPDTLE